METLDKKEIRIKFLCQHGEKQAILTEHCSRYIIDAKL